MRWRWASASVIGTSHIQSGARIQDARSVVSLGHDSFVAVVSDGAGTARLGGYGARILCRFITTRFREWHRNHAELPTDEQIRHWIDDVRDWTSTLATRRGTVARQFAATVAAIVMRPNEILTLQIGDSSIVGRKDGAWHVLCWPENGEYASTTYFFTDDPEPRLAIGRHSDEFDGFALFSDGVGELALAHLERTAFPRFLDPMIGPIDEALGEGCLIQLSDKLARYLSGPSVCARTDDDKTLILISGK